MAGAVRAVATVGNYKVCPRFFLDPQGQPFSKPIGFEVLSLTGAQIGEMFADVTAALAYARGLIDAEAQALEESENSDAPRPC